MINHNYSFCSMKVFSSSTNACSMWQHVVKKYRLADTGDHQRVTNLLLMKWLIHHITLLIGNHGTLGIHVCILETQYMLIFIGICSGTVYMRACWKVMHYNFLYGNGYIYLNETKTGNFLKLYRSLLYSYFSTWSPLWSTHFCQRSSSFVSLSQ
jgi:hypothetical protein